MLGILVEAVNPEWVPTRYMVRRVGPHSDDKMIGIEWTGKMVNDHLNDYQGPPSRFKRWYADAFNSFAGLWVDPLDDRFKDDVFINEFLQGKYLRLTETYPIPINIDESMHKMHINIIRHIHRDLIEHAYPNASPLKVILRDMTFGLIRNIPFKKSALCVEETYIQYALDVVKEAMAEEGDKR